MSRTLSVCVLCACTFLAGLMLGQSAVPAVAQAPAVGQAGRYQISQGKDYLFMDTQTGKCWVGLPSVAAIGEGKVRLDWALINTPAAPAK